MDEGELRASYPAIPWDQPVRVRVTGQPGVWCCRYCIALHGIKATEVFQKGWETREEALDHIEEIHHD